MLLKDKKFYRMFLILCLPIVLQNVISLSVNLTDNLMLGSYAESALSGVTAVNQIQFIYQNLLIGIGDGLVILASQYWGKKGDHSQGRKHCHAHGTRAHARAVCHRVAVPGAGSRPVYQ